MSGLQELLTCLAKVYIPKERLRHHAQDLISYGWLGVF